MESINIVEAFEKFNVQLYKYIFVRVNRNRTIAEDITQDVFFKAWKNRESFDSRKASVKTWLFTIAKNKLIDYYRTRKHDTIDLAESEGIAHTHDIVEETENAIQYQSVIRMMELLSDNDRDIIVLRYINEMTITEIAHVTGKTEVATKVSLHRALGRLKHLINKE